VTPSTLAAAVGCTPARAELYAPFIDEACQVFQITTPARLAAWLAQIGHESGSFQYTEELASGEAYEGRANLGNTEPGDGPRYRGHGLIQTTGRFNHRATTNGLRAYGCPDFEAEPDKLSEPRWAALSAGWYWQSHGCNALADEGDFERITRVINGGMNGYEDRKRRWEKAKAALGAAPATQVPTTSENAPTAQPTQPKGGLMPFLIPALTAIMQAIPTLAAKWGGDASAVATRNIALATTVVDTVKTAIGAVNEQQLVEKLATEPQAVQQAADAVQEIWWQIDGSGIPAAREADTKFAASGAQVWRSPSFLFTVMMMPLIYFIVGGVLGMWGKLALSEAVVGNILTGLITAIAFGGSGYYYGAMTSSNKTGATR
jgi:putative chitinase